MKLSQRDKLIVVLVPALGIFTIYGWLIYPRKQAAWTNTLAVVRDAQAKFPALHDKVMQTQAKVPIANSRLKSLENDKQQARQAWERAAASCTDAKRRNERIEKLNRILAARKLRVIEDAEAEAEASKDGRLAPLVESLSQELAAMSAQAKPHLRKVRMEGQYLDVLAALDDLANRDVVAIPVALTMKPGRLTSTLREWLLLVWI